MGKGDLQEGGVASSGRNVRSNCYDGVQLQVTGLRQPPPKSPLNRDRCKYSTTLFYLNESGRASMLQVNWAIWHHVKDNSILSFLVCVLATYQYILHVFLTVNTVYQSVCGQSMFRFSLCMTGSYIIQKMTMQSGQLYGRKYYL